MSNYDNLATEKKRKKEKKMVTGDDDVALRDWSGLTPELLTVMFSLLPLEDLWRGARMACKPWRDAALGEARLVRALDLEPAFAASGPGGRDDAAGWWTSAFQRRVDGMLRLAAMWGRDEVREIRVRHCSDDALTFLADRCKNLRILSVSSSQSVTDRAMLHVSVCCKMLVELDISNCYEVSYVTLGLIGRTCPNLTILKRNFLNWLDPSQHARIVPDEYLRALPQDGDREAETISEVMPNLKHLELQFSKLSVTGLISISNGCKDLELLDISGCANLTLRGIEQAAANLKNIVTLLKPNFFFPRSSVNAARYGHWQLYDERFQTNVFQI